MSIHAQYAVRCVGGGWLDPGRPLICFGGARKFASAMEAFLAAKAVGWVCDLPTGEHRCPQHQTGTGHVHYFKKTGTIKACVCGETVTESEK